MDRVINYFNMYSPLTEEAKDFLIVNGKIKQYPKNSYYVFNDEKKDKWSYIIEGLVGIISFDNQKEIIERIYTSHFYFSGTKHIYTNSAESTSIKFLRSTIIFEISHIHFIKAIDQFQELKNIYLILKEHEIQYSRNLISILKASNDKRIHEFAIKQPNLFTLLIIKEKISYLNLRNNKEYYRSLRYHLYSK